MLYKKNGGKTLDMDLFRSPTAEYRGTPFWSWNCKLEEGELIRQIDVLKEMGFGGFHMHSRAGMASEYLGEEFMHMVKACTEKAKREEMLAWLYDEDRWPSGFAGGYVTRDHALRGRYILFTRKAREAVPMEEGIKEGKTYLLATFDIELDGEGRLLSSRLLADGEEAVFAKWYIYVESRESSGRWNGQAYVDTLSKDAMRKFIDITYEAYKREVGGEFDRTVPAIFTDEPQFVRKETASFGADDGEVKLPWTPDLPETYREAYGEDILPLLPELRWERADGYSRARYRYHDHVCERFTSAFIDLCGDWCNENGIALTGHMMHEATLTSQTMSLGEAMRCYRNMALPGIDILCNRVEFSTAKQVESSVHQYGREGMLSELYGVTGWSFDFRGHKFQGDWQAALGVTVRVPHLSWVSMKGSAKRDYPASISYQVPWYKEYRLIEDHFARVATVLTRGKPVVKVAVIHPIESFWLLCGPKDATAAKRADMEADFDALIKRLLYGTVDFDFVSESLLPSLYREEEEGFAIGEMRYDAVVVPELITMRSTTRQALKAFADKGGKVIFIGSCPTLEDAEPSENCRPLYERALHISSVSEALLDCLREERSLEIRNADGSRTDDLLYQLREDGDCRYLFVAHGKEPTERNVALPRRVILRLRGGYVPSILDTATGDERQIPYEIQNGDTVISYLLGPSDSLLLRLRAAKTGYLTAEEKKYTPAFTLDSKRAVSYRREEDNLIVLDLAEWSEDGVTFRPEEEILRIDEALRQMYGYPRADGGDAQPWVIPDLPPEHFPVLRYRFFSEIEAPLTLAFEEATEITFNGKSVPVHKNGYYIDKAIHTVALPSSVKGENILTVRMPITGRLSLEACYLLGDFDVALDGCVKTLVAPRREIPFGSVTGHGLPFYGGNLIYKMEFETPDADIDIRVTHYSGALLRLYVDGKDVGELIYSPYVKHVRDLSAGKHVFEVKLYGNRQNTFGPLHLAHSAYSWLGPGAWYTKNEEFSYEYTLKPFGVLASPEISVYPK